MFFLAQAGPKSLESLLQHAACSFLVIWSQEEGGCSDAPSARVQGQRRCSVSATEQVFGAPSPPLIYLIWRSG